MTLTLETIGMHDQHSHKGGKMHARKSTPGIGGFSRRASEGSASQGSVTDESGWCFSIDFPPTSVLIKFGITMPPRGGNAPSRRR